MLQADDIANCNWSLGLLWLYRSQLWQYLPLQGCQWIRISTTLWLCFGENNAFEGLLQDVAHERA